MPDKIYGLNERDKRLLQQMLREFNRQPRDFAAPRGGQKVRSTADRFRFRNDSGETIPPGGIMFRTGSEVDSDGNILEVMDKPGTVFGSPHDWFVNMQVEIEDEAEGTCATFHDAVGKAYFLSGTVVSGEWWGPKPGQWNLERYHLGFRVHGETADDDGQVFVQQYDQTELWGTLDGSLSQGSSATMSIFCHNGSSWVNTTANITVYDRLLKTGAAAVQSGKWVVARWYSGRYWAEAAECNT